MLYMVFLYRASESMAPPGAVAPNTTPASAGLRGGSPLKWVHSNDCIHKRVIPDKESGICSLYHNYILFMSGYDTPALAAHNRPSPRRGSPLKFVHSNDCIQKLVIHDTRVKSKRWSDQAHRSLEDGARKDTARARHSSGWSSPSTPAKAALAKIKSGARKTDDSPSNRKPLEAWYCPTSP
jgi:hypothetical protein